MILYIKRTKVKNTVTHKIFGTNWDHDSNDLKYVLPNETA